MRRQWCAPQYLSLPARWRVGERSYLSAAVWQRGNSKVVLLFNHDPEQARLVALNLPLARGERIYTYPDRHPVSGARVRVTIEPLDAVVFFVESEKPSGGSP